MTSGAGLSAASRGRAPPTPPARCCVFAATLVLARLLVPSEFGLVAFALSVMYALDYVADLGLGAALIYRSDAEDPRITSTAFWIGLAADSCCTRSRG